DDPKWRPSHFGYGRWGFQLGMEFPVRKLLDWAPHWQALEANPNPFAVVVLAHLKTLETRDNPVDRRGREGGSVQVRDRARAEGRGRASAVPLHRLDHGPAQGAG